MFTRKYFAGRYFAPVYWPQGVGVEAVDGVTPLEFELYHTQIVELELHHLQAVAGSVRIATAIPLTVSRRR